MTATNLKNSTSVNFQSRNQLGNMSRVSLLSKNSKIENQLAPKFNFIDTYIEEEIEKKPTRLPSLGNFARSKNVSTK